MKILLLREEIEIQTNTENKKKKEIANLTLFAFQVNQINIKFAKTAKVVDMKQLKTCCLNLIRKDCLETADKAELPCKSQTLQESYIEGAASFYQLYKDLPQKLTKGMKEALSPAVAFYSILHLANDNNFRLIKDEDNGFLIRQIQSK